MEGSKNEAMKTRPAQGVFIMVAIGAFISE